MAGNTINVQGNYIDIHDNEVVNIALSERGANLFATPSQSNVNESNLNIDKASEQAKVLADNKKFMQILQKAVEQGFCQQVGWQYKWDVKVEAAYFASLVSEKFKLSKRKINGKPTVSWVPFEALFGLNDLRMAFNDYKQCKTALVREEEIDELFE